MKSQAAINRNLPLIDLPIAAYLPGGELFDYILQKGSLSESEARTIFRELVSAIGYAHQKGVAHRDLKPENILLDEYQNIRVIDFGLCAKNADNTLLDTFCGSLAYAAPEILANKEYSGPAADIWSMGVILYSLLCGCLPFDPTKPEKLPQIIAKGKYAVDESLSKSSRHLLSRLLCVDPEKRISMQELCHHPWVMGEDLQPIDLLLDPRHNLPLNSDIVREISSYTHIPKVEMARMLRRRSYDYLMATYMIMEQLYLVEGILLRLQRRDHITSRHQASVVLGSTPSTDWQIPEAANATQAPRMRPSRHHTTCGSGLGYQGLSDKENVFQTPFPPSNSGPQILVPYNDSSTQCALNVADLSIRSSSTTRSVGSQTSGLDKQPSDERVSSDTRRGYKLTALSPGRSIDSQLNHLTKEVRIAEPKNLCRTPSARFDFALRGEELNGCTDDSNSSDARIFYGDELDDLPTSNSDAVTHNTDAVLARGDELEPSTVNTTDNGSATSFGNSVGWQSRRIFRQLLARKTLTASSAAATATGSGVSSASKLRKVRHANNVILTKPNLSVSEVLERIAEALRKNSIRFTLKRHGFLCVFANDWGKTQLSFELEVVDTSCKSAFPRLLAKKPLMGGTAAANDRAPLTPLPTTVASGLQDSPLPTADPSTGSRLANQPQKEAPSPPAACTLGVKMKRLHGDAYTYTSICRTILQQADVKIN
ncbi:hypothetical protein AAHC03_013536 [Spirometra sp. Aus1]